MVQIAANPLAEQVYARLKDDIFEFRLLPGDRFTETEMAERYAVSRTPLRDALYRLQREGFLAVEFRRGWQVRPLDFDYFEDLYDLRVVLEMAAVERICNMPEHPPELLELKRIWAVPRSAQEAPGRRMAELDESFHSVLVAAGGNAEMARVHRELTEKLRIIRRLDFTQPKRIDATYDEHAKVLKYLLQRKAVEAGMLLRSHIEQSKLEVRKLTLHRLHEARSAATSPEGGAVRRQA